MIDVSTYLLAGERLLWSGRPRQGLMFTSRDAVLVPFSLVWLSFVVFWTMTAARGNAPGFFILWGMGFLAIGLFFTIGRFFVDAWIRARLIYAVTNQRILVIRPAPFANLVTLGLGNLPQVSLSEGSGGRGTIRFGDNSLFATFGRRNGFASWVDSLDPVPQFLGIEDAKSVFNQIQSLSSASRQGGHA
jgi:hypothetical protein